MPGMGRAKQPGLLPGESEEMRTTLLGRVTSQKVFSHTIFTGEILPRADPRGASPYRAGAVSWN